MRHFGPRFYIIHVLDCLLEPPVGSKLANIIFGISLQADMSKLRRYANKSHDTNVCEDPRQSWWSQSHVWRKLDSLILLTSVKILAMHITSSVWFHYSTPKFHHRIIKLLSLWNYKPAEGSGGTSCLGGAKRDKTLKNVISFDHFVQENYRFFLGFTRISWSRGWQTRGNTRFGHAPLPLPR